MRLTAREVCKLYNISSEAKRVASNPHMDDSSFPMDHWKVTLSRVANGARNQMVIFFSKGHGHFGAPPTTIEVLECLALEAAPFGANGRGITFEEWCSEYGFDVDSRRAEKTFRACKDNASMFHTFLGPMLFALVVEEGLKPE